MARPRRLLGGALAAVVLAGCLPASIRPTPVPPPTPAASVAPSPSPTPLPTPASVANRGFGTETTLAAAQAAVPFAVRLPAEPELGPPDAVFLAVVPEGGTVTLTTPRGRVEHTRGLIAWSPATGAHEVHGSIWLRYRQANGARGFLGFPLTD